MTKHDIIRIYIEDNSEILEEDYFCDLSKLTDAP